MVCDVSTLHIGCISAADQLSDFIHTERLIKIKTKFGFSVCTKQTTDQLLVCNQWIAVCKLEMSQTTCDEVTELA